MDIERTMLWAGLLALLFIYLAFQTAMARDENSSVGEGTGELLKKSRVLGNLAEHAPLMLIMMMMLEKFFCSAKVQELNFNTNII